MSELVIYKSLDKIMEENLYPSPAILYKIAKETDPKITMSQTLNLNQPINKQKKSTLKRHLWVMW